MTYNNGSIPASAYIMEQHLTKTANFCSCDVTIDEVERRAGINILPALPVCKKVGVEGRIGGLRTKLGC